MILLFKNLTKYNIIITVEDLEKEIEKNMRNRVSDFTDFVSNLEAKYAPKKTRKSITDGKDGAKKRKTSKK